jgi:hypothetical protein
LQKIGSFFIVAYYKNIEYQIRTDNEVSILENFTSILMLLFPNLLILMINLAFLFGSNVFLINLQAYFKIIFIKLL